MTTFGIRSIQSLSKRVMTRPSTSGFVVSPGALVVPVRHLKRHLSNSRRSFLDSEEARIAQHAVKWGTTRKRPLLRPSISATIEPLSPATAASQMPDSPRGEKLDGKATSRSIREEIRDRVNELVEKHGEEARPGLAVIIVGKRADSMTYVEGKRNACGEVGIRSHGFELPEDVPQHVLEEVVEKLNNQSDVHGILVQLPLPDHINEEAVLSRISIEKDVDGFHPLNIGRLCMTGRTPPFSIPCTPKACIELLDRYGIDVAGQSVVVIGRSNIVGLPVAMLLLHRNATVTICHSRTTDTEQRVRQADIIVAACGIPGLVKKEWLKPGVVVIDVGINPIDDPSKKKGYRIVGDVDYVGASEVASYITPVPGGVGPMTITMLLQNTLDAATRKLNL